MLRDKIARLILDTADPVQAILGFGREIGRYRRSDPVTHNAFMKHACSLIGTDYLVDRFIETAKMDDVHLVQAIEKKAFDQKITHEEIANYLEQGGVLDLLEKDAFAISKKVMSEIKPELRKEAGINQAVAGTAHNMAMGNMAGQVYTSPYSRQVGVKAIRGQNLWPQMVDPRAAM